MTCPADGGKCSLGSEWSQGGGESGAAHSAALPILYPPAETQRSAIGLLLSASSRARVIGLNFILNFVKY